MAVSADAAQVTLPESIFIPNDSMASKAQDQDGDGLKDRLEWMLASRVSPLLIFDGDESNTRWELGEPVALFQVRPYDCAGLGCDRRCVGEGCDSDAYSDGLMTANPFRLKIRYEFLWRWDGGYGHSSSCKDKHKGDNQGVSLELHSKDGKDWEIVSVHNSHWLWPGNSNPEWLNSHVKIYLSSHKHHQYFNTAKNHEDSVYTDYGCNDDVNGKGRQMFPNLISPHPDKRPNNVGEPEMHDPAFFINALDVFGFPGENAWGTKPFTGGMADSCVDEYYKYLGAKNPCPTSPIGPWLADKINVSLTPAILPGSVSSNPNHLAVFTVDPSGKITQIAWGPENANVWTSNNPLPSATFPPYAPISAVSRNKGLLDIFGVGLDGQIYTASKDANGWHGPRAILDRKAKLGSSVYAISRQTDTLDIFVVGTDGGIYTAAWDNRPNLDWRGWWRIGDIVLEPGSPVTAVSRNKDNIDVFVVGKDGRVYTAAWGPQTNFKWMGWWKVLDFDVYPGSPVSAVSSNPDYLDIFVAGKKGRIDSARWYSGSNGWNRRNMTFWDVEPGTNIGVTSYSKDKFQIFYTTADGSIASTSWEPKLGESMMFTGIGGLTVTPSSPVTAISRDKGWIDLFVADKYGKVYSASWHTSFQDGWRGWWQIPMPSTPR